jgi:hypothetical protein
VVTTEENYNGEKVRFSERSVHRKFQIKQQEENLKYAMKFPVLDITISKILAREFCLVSYVQRKEHKFIRNCLRHRSREMASDVAITTDCLNCVHKKSLFHTVPLK